LLLLPIAIASGARENSPLESALVGNWVSNDRQFVEFRPDKTFRMYPKCGREAAEWQKRGTSFLPATWEVVDGTHLKLTIVVEGKSHAIDATTALAGDELRITDSLGHTEVNRRYTGAWPPACPAAPSR
jgi:hypothetical protein